MAKIYLSSTYADLVDERQAVYRTLRKLRHDVMAMEDYVATDERPLDKCLADVGDSDLYVGVFAWRYGYVPPDQTQSITELEFREAERLGKPCLLFLLADDAPWPRNRMDSDERAIEGLRAEIQRDHVISFFKTADELASQVGVAVANAWQPHGEETGQDLRRLTFLRDCLGRMTAELGKQIRFYQVSSGALLCVGIVILLTGLFVLGNGVFGLGGGFLGATTVFPMATMFTTRRKKVLLDGYADALTRNPPAREVVVAVERFLNSQIVG